MNNISIERQKLGLSQAQFAKMLGWGHSRLHKLHKGRHTAKDNCRP
ncbi:helix-turn-helix domain-containing protein [Pectobacterium punjabense]|nr:helix-turn-helix domain-containing protein [Pectobacterium punjabense]MCE5380446.1 helix-turn-helix domain-containing protein [Pectobacterium punjabense]